MANRERRNELKISLSDEEQYILERKVKLSNMRDKSAFIHHLILYGFVYDIDYSELREYNATLSKIGNNLNQIAKRMNATGNVYAADVKDVKELMNKVWKTPKAMLSKFPYPAFIYFSFHFHCITFSNPTVSFCSIPSIFPKNSEPISCDCSQIYRLCVCASDPFIFHPEKY